jgi:trigger factor
MSTGEHDPESPVSTADLAETEGASDAAADAAAEGESAEEKLDLDVDIKNVGPCKKHLTISIAPEAITEQFQESLGTMKREAAVPGFRPGHAPLSLIEKRFKKQVAEQVKATLLSKALEQIDSDYKLKPIRQPQLDVAAIALPDTGPLRFELEIEVRPEFPVPEYRGLTVNRPVKTITEDDVAAQLKQFLERYGQMVPKLEGGAELGDFLTADLTFHREGRVYNTAKEIQFRLQPELRFQDGVVPALGLALVGVKGGESRTTDANIGSGSPDPSLRGATIQVSFQVNDLKQVRLPEVNAAFLNSIGFTSKDELREALRDLLERRLKTQQRQAMRREIMDKLIAETSLELPEDLVGRQEQSTVNRLVMQLKQEGLNENEIRARQAEIRANARESTVRGLKEYFILEQIAEVEDVELKEEDFAEEIEAMAARSDESPRRVRARIEKEGMMDALASQILERKTLDRIFEHVAYQEVPLVEEEMAVETLDQTATSAPEPEPETPAATAEGSEAEGSTQAAATTEGEPEASAGASPSGSDG